MSKILNKKFTDIFNRIQTNSACHPKYLKLLTEVYKSNSLDEFTEIFVNFLNKIIQQSAENSIYMQRALTFCSRFCGEITQIEEQKDDNHPFLRRVIETVLVWSHSDFHYVRYNSCLFLTKVLQDIGEEVQLEIDLIEEIQTAALERANDPRILIRSEALSVLLRLQDPQNVDCPVMNLYLRELTSISANIRREAVKHIAFNNISCSKIIDRIRDIDPNVRSVAFHRCGEFGPRVLNIADRHVILLCGFKETNKKVKNTFYDYLLPKWLTAYNGDFLKFLSALKLIADEEDLNKMEYLCGELIRYFHNKHPIRDLIAALPLNDEKVIKEDCLTNEVSLFWKVLTNLLRESDDKESYLDEILPELTQFCRFLEQVINMKSQKKMDEWEYFEYQFDLLNLLEIAEKYDFSDEVGRRTMHSVILTILQKFNFSTKVIRRFVFIVNKCSSNIEFFVNNMCHLISDIREPLTEEQLSEDQQIEKNFKIATMKYKIMTLQGQQNEAVEAHDYQKAYLLENELETLKKELEKFISGSEVEKVRVVKSDNETMCRCLDILISILEVPDLTKPTPALLNCKEVFLVPAITSQSAEVHWRVLKCLGLFSIIDKATAEAYAKFICIPMATYRTIPNNNIPALIESSAGVVDLISTYGIEIIGQENANNNSTTTNQRVNKRKLYHTEIEEDMGSPKHNNITISDIFEILLEMLDDDRNDVRYKAVAAIGSLIKEGFPLSPSLTSRLILKWCNPLTEKQDSRLQASLGILLQFNMQSPSFCKVMKEAIIPTLLSIATAPKNSPLFDTNSDGLVTFFAETMNINLKKDEIKILALDICIKCSENLNDRFIALLAKLLKYLDIHIDSRESAREFIDRAEMLSESIKDKTAKKHIDSFLSKLKKQQASRMDAETRTDEPNIVQNDESSNKNENSDENEVNTVLQETIAENSRSKKTEQVKRKKLRNIKELKVVLERFDTKSKENISLQPLIETSMEMMEIDEDLTIQTSTSESSSGARKQNKVVISETSDSEDNTVALRASNRIRKKRIL